MRDTYSLYEAKARLSALVRRVREGGRVIITVRGEPAAELRPIQQGDPGLPARLARLEERGIVVRQDREADLAPIARRPGALQRFLEDRD